MDELAPIEKPCRNLAAAMREHSDWTWDDRFLMMLAVVPARLQDDVRDLLAKELTHHWEGGGQEIPRSVEAVVSGLGGLRQGQQLFTSDPAQDPVVFGAWWPWRNRQNVSVRVGVWSARLKGEDRKQLTKTFRQWFDD